MLQDYHRLHSMKSARSIVTASTISIYHSGGKHVAFGWNLSPKLRRATKVSKQPSLIVNDVQAETERNNEVPTMAHSSVMIPPELFIIVRPPPQSSLRNNNALNLQIQLVAPTWMRREAHEGGSGGTNNSTASMYAVAGATVKGRARASSVSSSTRSSTGTGTSTTSTRKTTPLYNLRFYPILPTVVTDAGTDTKIAKFLKKGGIEIICLGIFEPVQLKSSATRLALSRQASTVASVISPPPTPTASSFFGKFKKLALKPTNVVKDLVSPDDELHFTASGQPVVPLFRPDSNEDNTTSSRSSICRNGGYVWVVRKWTRPDLENGVGLRDIKFEWKKGTKREKGGSKRIRPTSMYSGRSTRSIEVTHGQDPTLATSASESERLEGDNDDVQERGRDGLTPSKQQYLLPQPYPPPSTEYAAPNSERIRSPVSPDRGARDGDGSENNEDEDGEESDAEDSERPWICHLIVDDSMVHLATLTPAPHHPKLVATLAVPFLLHPIDLGGNSTEGLSTEEMKDVVSVTALWLIVRERLGGMGVKKVKK